MRRDVFQAIADPTRREIIQLLASSEMNLNGLSDNFKMSRPAVSQQVKILVECGLVKIRQEGRERWCRAEVRHLKEVFDWVEHYKAFWKTKLDDLEKFLMDEIQQPKNKKYGKRKKSKR